MIQGWWAWLAASAVAYREDNVAPEAWEHFEWLARRMADMDGTAGRTQAFDEAHLARTLAQHIEAGLEEIHTAEELRAAIVRPMSPMSPASEPAATPAAG